MAELKLHLDNGRLLIYISIITMIATIVTHLIFKKYRFMKYVPGFILLIIGVYNLYMVSSELTSSESIKNILLFVIYFIAGFVGLFSGLIIGIYNKPRKSKVKKEKTE